MYIYMAVALLWTDWNFIWCFVIPRLDPKTFTHKNVSIFLLIVGTKVSSGCKCTVNPSCDPPVNDCWTHPLTIIPYQYTFHCVSVLYINKCICMYTCTCTYSTIHTHCALRVLMSIYLYNAYTVRVVHVHTPKRSRETK